VVERCSAGMPRPRPPQRASRRPNAAADRAVRAATAREPLLPPGFLGWAFGRALAMALLVGAAWVVYDSASSDRFQVRSIHVQGNVLLGRAEVEQVVAAIGANVFWIDPGQVAARVRALPLVQRAEVGVTLPDTVDVTIVERQPAGYWVSGGTTYLVDREGVILKAVDPDTPPASMPTVAQMDGQPLTAGSRVDARALAASAQLTTLLPDVGVAPLAFEWSPDAGLEVPTQDGWRARFDETGSVDQQVAVLRAIRDELTRTRSAATLIDVRFGDRPYIR